MSNITTVRLPDGTERNALELDFAVEKEDWSEYRLDDGTGVLLRTTAVRIFRVLDDDGEPSFTAEGEPELLVWHDTTGMSPSNLEVALTETDAEQTIGDGGGTLPAPLHLRKARSRPAARSASIRVIPGPSYGGNTEASERPLGKARNPFIAWAIASLRIMWSSLRHPGHPVWIDYRTGDVWLKRD